MGVEPTRRERILAMFDVDLPDSVRILNAPAITEELEFGRDVTVDDDQLPSQEVYDSDVALLAELVDEGIVLTAECLEMAVYGRNREHEAAGGKDQ